MLLYNAHKFMSFTTIDLAIFLPKNLLPYK